MGKPAETSSSVRQLPNVNGAQAYHIMCSGRTYKRALASYNWTKLDKAAAAAVHSQINQSAYTRQRLQATKFHAEDCEWALRLGREHQWCKARPECCHCDKNSGTSVDHNKEDPACHASSHVACSFPMLPRKAPGLSGQAPKPVKCVFV